MTNREDLAARAASVRRALVAGLLAVLFFVVLALLLVDSPAGLRDVQVPTGGVDLLLHYPGTLPAGEPYSVAQGVGRLAQILSSLIQTSTLGAAGLLVWALVKRRKTVAWAAAGWLALVSYAGPVPTMMQPAPPIAVSLPVARTALGVSGRASPAWDAEKQAWRRYMLAQIAYIEGDRAAAARLAAGLTPYDILSPIEGDYRLQFLQGRPPMVTTACFKFGCLTPAGRWWGQVGAIALAVLAAALVAGVALLWRTLRRRLAAIETIAATGRRLRVTT